MFEIIGLFATPLEWLVSTFLALSIGGFLGYFFYLIVK